MEETRDNAAVEAPPVCRNPPRYPVVGRGTLSPFSADVKARHDKTGDLAETTLKLHKDLPKAKTPHEQESLQRQIAATDKAIDALVYELYGLGDDEIRIAKGEW